MTALGFATFGDNSLAAWASLGAGVLAASLVLGAAVISRRWRGPVPGASREEDLPWQDLRVLLEKRRRDRDAAGLPPEEPTEEEFVRLLGALPDARPVELPEDREFMLLGGDERRTGRRRWGNPTEIHLRSTLWVGRRHGLVVNRSTGGLGIFADNEVPPGTLLKVRAVEAPGDVPAAEVEVRHCRKVGSGFLFGCQFSEDVPWNARVWFG